ncbi:MAG: adaptor protein MecA [Ruminococcaceae bacterium]|nr:adaptor protein MecA [Oscillospiraceae bacterium]
MTYTVLKGDRFRISLNKEEMLRLFGSKEKICEDSKQTQYAINLLLKKAISDSGFKVGTKGVFTEIVGNISGGCDIYFIKPALVLKLKEKRVSSFVLEFKNCNDAIAFSKSLASQNSEFKESRFFKMEKGFRLILSANSGLNCENCAFGFSKKLYKSEIEKAKTEEYGKELIPKNAISVLAKL